MKATGAKLAAAALAVLLASGAAGAETVSDYELKVDDEDDPCALDMETQDGPKVSLELSDYEGNWSLNFFVSGVPETFRTFFDSNNIVESDKFEDAFQEITIGSRDFAINDTQFYAVEKSEVDAQIPAVFSVEAKHNVARAVEAMKQDGVSIDGLVDLENTREAMTGFRSCAQDALGLREGESVATDFRAEYRMVFEDAFELWIENMARADACGVSSFKDAAVSDVISEAASAFYPGIMNMMKRREYRASLSDNLPFLKLSGSTEAATEGCMMAGTLAEASRQPVDRAIEAGREAD